MEDTTGINEKLRVLRESAKLSQEALAARSGVSRRTIQDIESGKTKPTLNTIEALTGALGVPSQSIMPSPNGAMVRRLERLEANRQKPSIEDAIALLKLYNDAEPVARKLCKLLLGAPASSLDLDANDLALAKRIQALIADEKDA